MLGGKREVSNKDVSTHIGRIHKKQKLAAKKKVRATQPRRADRPPHATLTARKALPFSLLASHPIDCSPCLGSLPVCPARA